jgi:tetrahydromethanopterin S-methyltransferase subunit G
MSKGEVIGTIIGAVLGLVICLVLHYWNKVNKE